ncbi:MAG: hypothetical protein ACK559_02080, partial [bacterium]
LDQLRHVQQRHDQRLLAVAGGLGGGAEAEVSGAAVRTHREPVEVETAVLLRGHPGGGAGGEAKAAALGLIPGQQVVFQVGVIPERRQADAGATAAESRGEQALAVRTVVATGGVAVG